MAVNLENLIKNQKENHFPAVPLEELDPLVRDKDVGITVEELYSQTIPEYILYDPEIVGYPDKEMQEDLYRWTLQEICPLTGFFSILDIGAGRGDLQKYIERAYPEVMLQYHGIESNPNLIQAAETLGNRVVLGTFGKNEKDNIVEWAVCVGSLNEDYDMTGAKWDAFNNMLQKSLVSISKGIVFILLAEDADFVVYPIPEMVSYLAEKYPNIPFKIDYSKFNKIYKLTIFNEKYPE